MKLLKSYFWWTYERGSVHYDVMVTLILLFLFVSPQFIEYGARPVANVPLRDSEVLVKEAGTNGQKNQFIYEIRAGGGNGSPNASQSESERVAAIMRTVEPISGEVTLDHYEPVMDGKGKIVAYDAWVLR